MEANVSFRSKKKFQLSLPPALLDDIGLSPFTQNPSGVEFIVGEADRSYCGSFKNEKFKGRRTIISNEPFTKKFNISQLRCIPPTSGGPYGSTSAQIRIATKNLGRTGDLISSELVSLRGETDCSALDRIKESVGEYGVVNISGHRNVSSHTSEFALAKTRCRLWINETISGASIDIDGLRDIQFDGHNGSQVVSEVPTSYCAK